MPSIVYDQRTSDSPTCDLRITFQYKLGEKAPWVKADKLFLTGQKKDATSLGYIAWLAWDLWKGMFLVGDYYAVQAIYEYFDEPFNM